MKVGDLVSVLEFACEGGHGCGCWFCYHNSSKVGIALEKLSEGIGNSYWRILFDAGEWRLYSKELEVINET